MKRASAFSSDRFAARRDDASSTAQFDASLHARSTRDCAIKRGVAAGRAPRKSQEMSSRVQIVLAKIQEWLRLQRIREPWRLRAIEVPREEEDFKSGWKRTEDARRRTWSRTETASRSSLSCFGRSPCSHRPPARLSARVSSTR